MGKLLAAGRDVWNVDGTRLTGVSGRVNSVPWSENGRYLAVAADDLITLVRADGTHMAVLRDHADTVKRVAWSPASLILAPLRTTKRLDCGMCPLHLNIRSDNCMDSSAKEPKR